MFIACKLVNMEDFHGSEWRGLVGIPFLRFAAGMEGRRNFLKTGCIACKQAGVQGSVVGVRRGTSGGRTAPNLKNWL